MDNLDTVEISRAEYEALLQAKEDLEDIAAYDNARALNEEGMPSELVKRLLAGENPLRIFRTWREVNQSELSRTSGVNRTQIADIEAGRSNGSVETMKKLADALDVTVDELV